ncbi:MAG: lycopene cyclase family protein [Bacteroidota bacterium]|jgi:lycopene beta-cyclase
MLQPRYDLVFLGGGCATLSLLTRLIESGACIDKRFLIIDPSDKKSNDRTWCFWEKGSGYFEKLVHHEWGELDFKQPRFSDSLDMDGYRYKMIRGIDFYEYCLQVLQASGQVDFLQDEITDWSIEKTDSQGEILNSSGEILRITGKKTEKISVKANLIFNSIPLDLGKKQPGVVNLLQHFKGVIVESDQFNFDPHRATLMDFRVSQTEGTTFIYVLPLSKNKALVEYTLFTADLLSTEQYNQGIADYITTYLGVSDYKIVEEEFGIIPMTSQQFPWYANGAFNIGTAGGQTKGSSGYTFQFIQKRSAQLAALLQNSSDWSKLKSTLIQLQGDAKRFHFYDRVLLNVLAANYYPGDQVFATLFEKNPAHRVFQFLDNETNLLQELQIISTLPTWPFLKAALKSWR